MMPCKLPHVLLRISSHGCLNRGDDNGSPGRSLTSALRPWRELLAIILELFAFKNQAPTDPKFIANLAVVLACAKLLTDMLAAGVIHGYLCPSHPHFLFIPLSVP
jgi:hypothetical protein